MDEYGMRSREDRDLLIAVVQRMDAYYLSWVAERLEKEADRGTSR